MSKQRIIDGPYVWMTKELMGSAAWKALPYGDRVHYWALKGELRNDAKNNGNVYLSLRYAAEEMGIGKKDAIGRSYKRLQHYGFIVQTEGACLGTDGVGRPARWRLTELPTWDEAGNKVAATKDYLCWDGTQFRNPKPRNRLHTIRKKTEPCRGVGDRVSRRGGQYCRGVGDSERDSGHKTVAAWGTYLDGAIHIPRLAPGCEAGLAPECAAEPLAPLGDLAPERAHIRTLRASGLSYRKIAADHPAGAGPSPPDAPDGPAAVAAFPVVKDKADYQTGSLRPVPVPPLSERQRKQEWLKANPPSAVPGRCAHCGEPPPAGESLACVRITGGNRVFVHHGCKRPFLKTRDEQARAATGELK